MRTRRQAHCTVTVKTESGLILVKEFLSPGTDYTLTVPDQLARDYRAAE